MGSVTFLLRLLLFLWGTSVMALSLLFLLSDLPRLAAMLSSTEPLVPIEVVFKLLWPVLVLIGAALVRVALRPLPEERPTPPQALELYPDRPLTALVGAAELAAALPCAGLLAVPELGRPASLAVAALALLLVWRGCQRLHAAWRAAPFLRLDAEGIRAPSLFEGVLPWSSICEARLVPASLENLLPTFLSLGLRAPPAAPAEAPQTAAPSSVRGRNRISVNLSFLDGDPQQTLSYVQGQLDRSSAEAAASPE